MKVVALIPIKLNSQRLPHKNILPVGGHPLCWYICNTLNNIPCIDEAYVYCSDSEVKKYLPEETLFLQRPAWLDNDLVKGFDIYNEFIKSIDADIYILAHSTSPFIRSDSIENALEHVISGDNDSALSAEKVQTFAWYCGKPINYDLNDIPRTQDIEPLWVETSAFYIFKKEVFTIYKRRIGHSPYIQEVSGVEAIDIDEKEDYELACRMAEVISNEEMGK